MYCHIFQNIVDIQIGFQIRSFIDVPDCCNYSLFIVVRHLSGCAVPDRTIAVQIIIRIIEVCTTVAVAEVTKVTMTALWIPEFFIHACFIRASLRFLRPVASIGSIIRNIFLRHIGLFRSFLSISVLVRTSKVWKFTIEILLRFSIERSGICLLIFLIVSHSHRFRLIKLSVRHSVIPELEAVLHCFESQIGSPVFSVYTDFGIIV